MEKNEGELLRQYIRASGKTQEEFADMLKMTRQNLGYHMRKDKLDTAFKSILHSHGINIFSKMENKKSALVEEGTPVYELSASASQMDNISQIPEVPAFTVKIPGYEDCNFGMYVYGHSMYPTIENGSLILCRKINDKSIIMYGEIYLIRTKDYLMVKRIQKNETKGNVLCTSDNFEKRSADFRRFEPFDIPIDKIIDLYLVKGIIKKTQS